MGQQQRILSQIVSYQGWRVQDFYWENAQGQRIFPIAGYFVPPEAILILALHQNLWVNIGSGSSPSV
jgi:hypothetical protein